MIICFIYNSSHIALISHFPILLRGEELFRVNETRDIIQSNYSEDIINILLFRVTFYVKGKYFNLLTWNSSKEFPDGRYKRVQKMELFNIWIKMTSIPSTQFGS